jgi:hypothetical protein
MRRPSYMSGKLVALALVAGASGACSNADEEDASDTTGQEQYVQQIQSELDAAAISDPNSFNSFKPVRPVLKCVDKLANNQYNAHFGYTNTSATSVSIPVGFFNRFWPPPISRGQPTTFAPGSQADVVQVPFSDFSASIWVLGNHFSVATRFARVCPTGGGTGGSGTGGSGAGGSGTGGSGTGGSGTGGRGAGGSGTGGSGTGGSGVGGSGTGGRGTGGSGTGGSGIGGSGVGGSGVGGSGVGGSGVGGSGVGGSGVGGSGVGGSGTGGRGTGGTGGVCVPPTNCDDQNPCTIDSVDLTACACVHIAGIDGTTCNDNNACTTVDACVAGACVGGSPKTCAALDQCHIAGVCAPATGVCSNPVAPNGRTCNDGNACTQSDICTDGICTMGTPILCNAPDVCHTAGTCNSATGACSNPSAPNGTACNDSNACTATDSCQAGACVGSSPKSCPATDTCHIAGVCNPANGTCSNPTAPDGTTCDDANLCSSGDACRAGLCVAPTINPATHCDSVNCEQCTSGVPNGQVDVCSATAESCFNCDPTVTGCDLFTDPADKALCEAVYACFVAPTHPGAANFTGFCFGAGGDPLPCWCGTNQTTCATSNAPPTQANGPCLQQIFAAAKSTDAATVQARFIDPSFPLGGAANLAICRGQFCAPECKLP